MLYLHGLDSHSEDPGSNPPTALSTFLMGKHGLFHEGILEGGSLQSKLLEKKIGSTWCQTVSTGGIPFSQN